ncbi:transposase [Xanthomonas fragariae]|uniref:transposase n=1 Tax=Xanthomonas fragariae TaxID=48664 RepID=UPI00387E74A4
MRHRAGTCASGQEKSIELHVIKLQEAKKAFVLLPHRWVVQRSFGWANRFRHLTHDDKRLPETLSGLHCIVFAIFMRGNASALLQSL